MSEELAVSQEASVIKIEVRVMEDAEVHKHQAQIRASFVGALPETHHNLETIDAMWKEWLVRLVLVWGIFADYSDGSRKIVGIMTTRVSEYPLLKERRLFIQTFFKLPGVDVPMSLWPPAFEGVRALCKQANLKGVEGLSDQPGMIEIAKAVGFNTEIRYLWMGV